jgi:TonB family protein
MAAVANVAGSSAGYVWEDPGDSIMVQVNLDLVERLGAAVQRGLGEGQRGTEIGGILLGRTLPGFGRAVLIEDFELTPCEHLRGASHTLSPKDRRALAARLERRAPRQVVGYFRSHTRPGMYLDQDDFTVFSQYFPETWQVFLLVRPTPMLVPPVAAPAAAPKPEARGRRLPSLPWVVVPVIAVLFLIAGLFVSENQTPVHQAAVPKVTPPVESLLPEPVPQQAASPQRVSTPEPAAAVPEATRPAPASVAESTAATPKPIAPPKTRAAKKPLPTVAVPPPVNVARAPVHEVEPPPPLAAPMAKIEPKQVAWLPQVHAAPPLEAEVSYDAPHAGVFRRALRKIEGSNGDTGAFTPPAPIRKVAPVKPPDAEAGARAVDVRVSIDESGSVTHAQVLTKGGGLAVAALSAARQWQFTPARKHDKPVASEMVLHFRF